MPVAGRQLLFVVLNKGLHLRDAGDARLSVTGDRNRLSRFDGGRKVERRRKAFQLAVDVVVLLGVSVVGTVNI